MPTLTHSACNFQNNSWFFLLSPACFHSVIYLIICSLCFKSVFFDACKSSPRTEACHNQNKPAIYTLLCVINNTSCRDPILRFKINRSTTSQEKDFLIALNYILCIMLTYTNFCIRFLHAKAIFRYKNLCPEKIIAKHTSQDSTELRRSAKPPLNQPDYYWHIDTKLSTQLPLMCTANFVLNLLHWSLFI